MKNTTIICLLAVSALVLTGCSQLSIGALSAQDKQINALEQEVAEQLASALTTTFTATAGAYTTPESGGPPGGVYPFPPIDIIEVSFGTTQTDLFLKLTFTGTIPHDQIIAFDNRILGTSTSICLDTDQDPNTGCRANYGAEILLVVDDRQGVAPFHSALYFTDPTGIEEPEPSRYANKGNGTIILGGIGYNFVAAKFSLAKLKVQKGQSIDIEMWSEAESDKWHHFSFKRLPKHTITI